MCTISERLLDWMKRAHDVDRSSGSPPPTMRESVFLAAHPFLLAVGPIVHLYSRNMYETDAGTAIILCCGAMVLAASVLSVAWLWQRSLTKAALMTSLFMALFYLYGWAFDLVMQHEPIKLPYNIWHFVLLLIWLTVIVTAGVVMRHARRNLQTYSRFLSGALAIFVGMCLVKIVHHDVRIWLKGRTAQSASIASKLKDFPRMPPLDADSPESPDVYYIILDGYARADTLQRVCGFDNSEFIDFLRARGFYVAEESCANYPFTFLSLTSSLNMRYLDDLLPPKSEAREDGPIFTLLEQAAVPRIFQAKGYRFIYFATLFKSKWAAADETFRSRPIWMQNALTNVLWHTTALRLFETNIADEHLYQFENLKRVAHIRGPTFTFCHIIAPHPPYVFDREGNVLRDVPNSMFTKDCMERHSLDDESRMAYAEQVMYVNRRIEEDIDYLLANSPVPPIIIVQGDHGSFFTVPRAMTDANLDQFARERLPILNAYYVPDRMRAQLYPTVSPVNSFRMLFKEVYQDKFELLPEKNFVGWYSDKYAPRDVTHVFRAADSQAARNLAGKPETTKAAEQR